MKRKLLLSLAIAGCVAMTGVAFANNPDSLKEGVQHSVKKGHKAKTAKVKKNTASISAPAPVVKQEASNNFDWTVSGGANLDAAVGKSADSADMGDLSLPNGLLQDQRIANLNNAYVNVDGTMGEFGGRVGLSTATEQASLASTSATNGAHGLSADNIIVDQAFATYNGGVRGKTEGMYAQAGKDYLTFGNNLTAQGVEQPMIMSFTQALTNSNDINALVGYRASGFSFDGYVLQDAFDNVNGDRRANFGADVGYNNEMSNHNFSATLGYLNNIDSTNMFSGNGALSGTANPLALANGNDDAIGGVSLSVKDKYTLESKNVVDGSVNLFTTAQQSVAFDDENADPNKHRLMAYNAQVGFTMPSEHDTRLFAGYDGSSNANGILAKHRISGGVTYNLLQPKGARGLLVNLGGEVADDIEYKDAAGQSADNSLFGVARVGVHFG